MIVEAKFTTAGMTKGKRYDVIQTLDSIDSIVIVLDDGTVAVRHLCAFEIIDTDVILPKGNYKHSMLKCHFCKDSGSNGTCKWEYYHMSGSKESSCREAIENMKAAVWNKNESCKKKRSK